MHVNKFYTTFNVSCSTVIILILCTLLFPPNNVLGFFPYCCIKISLFCVTAAQHSIFYLCIFRYHYSFIQSSLMDNRLFCKQCCHRQPSTLGALHRVTAPPSPAKLWRLAISRMPLSVVAYITNHLNKRQCNRGYKLFTHKKSLRGLRFLLYNNNNTFAHWVPNMLSCRCEQGELDGQKQGPVDPDLQARVLWVYGVSERWVRTTDCIRLYWWPVQLGSSIPWRARCGQQQPAQRPFRPGWWQQ